MIEIDYEPLPANADNRSALSVGAPAVWEACPDNICYRAELGDRAAVDHAFSVAHHVTRIELGMPRVAVNPMEPRAALGDYTAADGRYTLYSGNQMPHDMRHWLARAVLNVPESQVRIVSPDMGDTDIVSYSNGTGGSRVSGLGSAALLGAVQKIMSKGRLIAAHALEVAAEDIEFSD